MNQQPRVPAVVLFLFAALMFCGLPAAAANPASGTVSDANLSVTWSGSSLVTTPTLTGYDPSLCSTTMDCDIFDITVNVSDAFRQAHPNFAVVIRADWSNSANDFDLFLYQGDTFVDDSGQGFTNFEEIEQAGLPNGTYRVYVHAWGAAPLTAYSGKVTIVPDPPLPIFRSATFAKDPDGKFGAQMFQFTSDLRLVGSENGDTGQNVEPDIKIDRFGTIYTSAIQGIPAGVDFWRSDDGGQTFTFLGQPDGAQTAAASSLQSAGIGGGDNDISIGSPFTLLDVPGVGKVASPGNVTVSSLSLANITTSNSLDRGENWLVSQGDFPVVDRQWNTSVGPSRVFLTSRQLGAGLVGTTSIFWVQSDDYGLTWPRGAIIASPLAGAAQDGRQGNMVSYAPGDDPNKAAVYNVFSGSSPRDLFLAACPAPCNLPLLPQGQLDPTVKGVTVRRIYRAPAGKAIDNVFPAIAVDRAGNLHVVFSDRKDTFLMSSRDGGNTWTQPVAVNNPADPEVRTTLEPWIVAGGDPGRVGVMFYATDRAGDPDQEAGMEGAEWKLWYAFTPDAFAATPSFQYVAASGQTAGTDQQKRGVVHVGSICLRGLDCDTPAPAGNPGDRDLAEYSSMYPDPLGAANILYSTDLATPNTTARVQFTRQTAGPLTLAGQTIGGGGWFDAENRKHFNIDIRSGSGSFEYFDKGAKLRVTSTTITSSSRVGSSATFSGAGTLDNAGVKTPVTFTVNVTDNGSPGKNRDQFSITLSSGYRASGTLGGGDIEVQ
ncbi:MAG TPA: sialidase family protein [Terriglobales bacterium]|nr:sialidase family protein [Terriglobales bacterium]